MKKIINNPPLSNYSLRPRIKSPFATLIVSYESYKTAMILQQHFLLNVFTFRDSQSDISLLPEEAVKRGLADFVVYMEGRLKSTEWILITLEDIYYSKGDGSNH